MCVHIYIYIYVYLFQCACACIPACTPARQHACMPACLHISSHTVTKDFPTNVSLNLKDYYIVFRDHATISATIPATICLCVVLMCKSIHEKSSQFLSGVFTEVFLSEIISFHGRSALREFAHDICLSTCLHARTSARLHASTSASGTAQDTPTTTFRHFSNLNCLIT